MASDSYYPTEEDPAAESADMEGATPSDAPDKSDYDSFLVPKSALHDPEPGMTEEIEILHVYDDEVEVRCVGKESKSKTAMDDADESLGKMAGMGE